MISICLATPASRHSPSLNFTTRSDFAVPGGPEAGATSSASVPAMLYAMNGTNGAALWNSGQTMTAALSGRSFWSATGQVYVGTTDGVVYAFGYPMERD